MVDRETAATADGSSFAQVRAASVEVRSGPSAGHRLRIEAPRFVIGSGEECDLRLDDRTVSRTHVVVSLRPDGVLVRDEGSRNGTFSGAMRLREVLLGGDTVLKIGGTTVAIVVDTAVSDVPIHGEDRFGEAIGPSLPMRHVFYKLARAATTDVSVLLEGESGVGKDVLARSIHAASARRGGPFVAVDCGAIPGPLFESEVFGHVRGAFTGADASRIGLAEQADGGTLFLDEIGELALDLQPKLLRLLEAREVRPVGAREVRKIDIRLLAATNRGLVDAVASGAFRQDLFYRLSVARVLVPPLRDRPEDIEPLATIFLRRALGREDVALDPEIGAMFAAYRWPGNVRELKNVVDRHALLGVRDRRTLFDAKTRVVDEVSAHLWDLPFQDARRVLLDDFEKSYLQRALTASGGIVVRAAERAGIPRPTFYRMLTRLGIRARE